METTGSTENDKPIPIEDSTPTVSEQAAKAGFEVKYFNFGLLEKDGNDYFNPSIVQREDGLWLLVRRAEPHPYGFSFGQNDVWAFEMKDDMITPTYGKRLKWRVTESSQHFEDPRGFYHPTVKQTMVGACTFIWYQNQRWTGAHQCFGAFDEGWNNVRMTYPQIGGNPGQMVRIEKPENYEKNWLWWLADEKLHLLYKARPWMVFRFRDSWADPTVYKDESGAMWAYGDIRGGTPPVKVGDLYFTFHHSSLPWKSRYRRYYAGCLAFEATPPFAPKLITKEPILIGSQNDTWAQKKPLVVFPCGAIFRNDEWFITMGVNDMKAAWAKIPHAWLMERMRPLHEGLSIFMESGLSDGEQQKERERGDVTSTLVANADQTIQQEQTTCALIKAAPKVRSSRRRRKYKMSPEGLANLRANAARARAARKIKHGTDIRKTAETSSS